MGRERDAVVRRAMGETGLRCRLARGAERAEETTVRERSVPVAGLDQTIELPPQSAELSELSVDLCQVRVSDLIDVPARSVRITGRQR